MKNRSSISKMLLLCFAISIGTLQAQDIIGDDFNLVFDLNTTLLSDVPLNSDACGDFFNSANPSFFIASQTLRTGNACESGFTTVQNDGRLVLKAGNSIALNPGFWAQPGSTVYAYIDNIDIERLTGSKEEDGTVSLAYPDGVASGMSIQPNPFEGSTMLVFKLSMESQIDLALFDAQGQNIRQLISNQSMSEGSHNIKVEANDLLPGVYYCRLRAGKSVLTHKVVLMR